MPRLRYAFPLIISLLFTPLAPLNAAPQTRAAQAPATSNTNATRTAAAAPLSRTLAATHKAAQAITQAKIREDLTYIASDALGGRDTPSPGLDMAAEYIAARMRKLKLKPAGDAGTYFQRIDLRRFRMNTQDTTAKFGDEQMKYGEDFLTTMGAGAANGKLVFVGNGYVVKSKNINAYQGVDVRDKVMIVTGGARPAGVTSADLPAATQGVEWSDPTAYAKANGARGIILLPRVPDFARWWEGRKRAMERGFTTVKAFEDANSPVATVPTMMPSEKLLLKLFEGEGERGTAALTSIKANTDVPAFDLNPAKIVSFTVQSAEEPTKTQNVVAVLEGSDPVLKNQYVAFGAHYDHVGTGTPVNGDAIYNGADDDGSGTTALMAIAEAFAKGKRPRRSILFVWHAGEEKGLWGARYFVENPTVPLNNIVAQLNIDMIGRSKAEGDTNPKNANLTATDEIYVIGSRMMSDALGNLTAQVNDDFLKIKLNYLYDDPADPNRFFFRSDHYHYAAKGIPIAFFFDGVHEDYHQPSDTVDKIDFAKMERVARTVFVLGSEVANAAERLKVDRPLPASLTR